MDQRLGSVVLRFFEKVCAMDIHPKVAQQLARHSTITLTMDRYSHARLVDLNAAVMNLPSLSAASEITLPVTGVNDGTRLDLDSTDPATGPNLTPTDDNMGLALIATDESIPEIRPATEIQKPLKRKGLRSPDDDCERLTKLRPPGFKPGTDGLEIRCSIQLSYGRKCLFCM